MKSVGGLLVYHALWLRLMANYDNSIQVGLVMARPFKKEDSGHSHQVKN